MARRSVADPTALKFVELRPGHWQVQGRTGTYAIVADPGRGLACSCPGDRFGGAEADGHCWHVRELIRRQVAAGMTNPDPVDPVPEALPADDPMLEGTAAVALPDADIPPGPPPEDEAPQEAPYLALVRELDQAVPDVLDQVDARLARLVPPAPLDEDGFSDLGNARRFVAQHGEHLLHVRPWRAWLVWDDRRWTPDDTGEAERRAKGIVDELYQLAAAERDAAQRKRLALHAARSSDARRIRSLLELACTEAAVVARPDAFDADLWALNTLSGTLDLRTGELRPHRRSDYLTRLAPVPYDATAPAPRWHQFLAEVTDGDAALQTYLQRAAGYTLTGHTSEQCLFFVHGQGANGKTVFCETLHYLLGPDYAQSTPFTTFLSRRSEGANNDIARMRAARMVSASEAPGGLPLDEALLKQLVGGDTVTARFLHQEFFDFAPQFKLWLRANHRPPVREQTEALWRRLRLVPFTVTIPAERRDPHLLETLRGEAAGILAWAVAGCLAWQRDGLGTPPAVTEATAAYREENDTLGEFLAARCALDGAAWCSTADLYQAFSAWWEASHGKHEPPLKRNWFGRALGERTDLAAEPRGHARAKGWRGIRLRDVSPSAVPAATEGEDDLPF